MDNVIRESDLIQGDGTIDRIINSLERMNSTLQGLSKTIREDAKDALADLRNASAKTLGDYETITRNIAQSEVLAKVIRELALAESDAGKQAAVFRDVIRQINRETVNQHKAQQAANESFKFAEVSYNRIAKELENNIAAWKALGSASERDSSVYLKNIRALRGALAEMDKQLKPTISELAKAQERLNFLQSAEGQQLLDIKDKIRQVTDERRRQKAQVEAVAQAQEKLAYIQSGEYEKLVGLNREIREQQRIAKLTNQLNNSAVGSYNQLAAQYELNKIRLNAMSAEERNATEAGKALERQTLAIHNEMVRLQETTGNHTLSVGNYKKAWSGLGFSVQQIVRELPSVAVTLNTFFLAISNNVPILIDEINKVRIQNKLLQQEGRETVSVTKQILKSLFSWQSALVLLLTAFAMNGKGILEWIQKVIRGRDYVISLNEALWNVNDALKKNNNNFGDTTAKLKLLSAEWQSLTSQASQVQWIKDNESAFKQLDLAINGVKDAEAVFVDNTEIVIKAFELRARAAAATKLAAEEYEKALLKGVEAKTEQEASENPSFFRSTANYFSAVWRRLIDGGSLETQMILQRKRNAEALNEEKEAAEATADQYIKLAQSYEEEARALLKSVNIEEHHKNNMQHQRDLTDQIWRNDLQIRKKYELAISKLQRDEFRKRRIEAIDQANATIREMQEKFRKNEEIIADPKGRYAELTEEQKAQIQKQQNEIAAIIVNTQRKLTIDLKAIEDERQIDSMKTLRQTLEFRRSLIEEDIEKEKQLRLKQIEEEEKLYTAAAATSEGYDINTGDMTPEQLAQFQRRKEEIIAEYDRVIYNLRKTDIEAQLELVKKGTDEELKLLLQQNENARRLALAENMAKPIEQRQSTDQINAQFDRSSALIVGSTAMARFDEAQAAADAEFNIVKRNETQITLFKLQQERDRWKEMVKLAKEGAIEWTDAQMQEAEAMIKKLEREIDDAGNIINLIGDKGVGGALLTKLGFDDDQIKAFTEYTNIIMDNIKMIVDAEVEAAEKAVAAAEKRVAAAEKAYDAEVEARNNGYANNVATAKKELQQERRNQAQKQRMLEEAQRRQSAIDTIMQASSLVTASANLWSTFSKIPFVGPALAMAAIATMWGSFVYAKVRAAQITSSAAEQEYGEGGLEILEGGSHASGNDINLGTKNSKGKNMRAEGGEAMAIINRRNTRRYKKVLPDIVNSLNKGTFEDTFVRAFDTGDRLAQQINYQSKVDLTNLESNVRDINKNTAERYYPVGDGTVIIKKGNVTRIIR